jgi:hypothetical protein
MPLNAGDKHVVEPQNKFDYAHHGKNKADA